MGLGNIHQITCTDPAETEIKHASFHEWAPHTFILSNVDSSEPEVHLPRAATRFNKPSKFLR